jgi:octopine oxidase subunit B
VAAPDLCIVGGGLLGTATAHYAAAAGLRVLLLEERELAAGASGAAFGGVSASVFSYSDTRVPEHYVRLSLESLRLYGELAAELGRPLDYAVRGQIDPFFDDGERPFREARARGLRECGVPVEVLAPDEVRQIEPALTGEFAGAAWCAIDGHVTPPCAVWAFADAARRHGAEVRTGVRVHAVETAGGRVVGVATSAGTVAAGQVVLCAGAGTAALAAPLGAHIPLDFSRGQMLVTERVPRFLRTYLHNLQQTAAGTVVIGVTREPGTVETSTTAEGTRQILSAAVRLIPSLAGVRVLRTWAGVRIVPAGGYPVFGFAGDVAGLLVCAMHRGVTLAPAVGRILAQLAAAGATDDDLEPYAPDRLAGVAAATVSETFYGSG